ncbi:MAG: hypothetical protein J1F11_02955 [Oscillospiraceae bacterium]|nr:hypothetical protein [Oscillospiraceae bacterium]
MKKIIYICSVLCGFTALFTFIMGIRMLTGHGYFFGLRMFNLVSRGSFTGFIGNLLGVVVTCGGFGALAFYGFGTSQNAKKNAFIYGIIMTVMCIVSMLVSFFQRSFTIGDVYILLLPAIYTFAILKSA